MSVTGPGAGPAPQRAHRLDGAVAWVAGRLAAAGLTVTGRAELTRDRPWSTQLRVPTDAGPAWFKANCPGMAFEAALHARLADLLPDDVDVPLGVEPARGWLLTRDRGATLLDRRTATPQDWADLLEAWARVQHALAAHGADLAGTGLPQRRPEALPERHEAVVAALAALPAGHPGRPDAEQVTALVAAAPRVAAAARALADGALPVTLQHGDLHPGNVFATATGLRIFDFGDAQWAAAAEALVVPWRVMEHDAAGGAPQTPDGVPPWPGARRAYRTAWSGLGHDLTEPALAALLAAALVGHAVHRAGTWLAGLAEATAQETQDWGEAPRAHLLTLLDPVPDRVADLP